jgi:hypothetical protein
MVRPRESKRSTCSGEAAAQGNHIGASVVAWHSDPHMTASMTSPTPLARHQCTRQLWVSRAQPGGSEPHRIQGADAALQTKPEPAICPAPTPLSSSCCETSPMAHRVAKRKNCCFLFLSTPTTDHPSKGPYLVPHRPLQVFPDTTASIAAALLNNVTDPMRSTSRIRISLSHHFSAHRHMCRVHTA